MAALQKVLGSRLSTTKNVFDASLLVGDFDLDGDEDILVEAGDSYWIIENLGGQNGFRSAVRRNFATEGLHLKPGTLRATDWDLDGDLDLVAVELANRRFVHFENRDRDLTFTDMAIVVGAIPGFEQIEIGDLNGDGRPDVVAEWANEAGWFANGGRAIMDAQRIWQRHRENSCCSTRIPTATLMWSS